MPPMSPLPLANGLARMFSRPSWADPEFMLAANTFSPQTVTIGAGATVKIAANDPKRWILGIVKPNPTTATVVIYPNGADPSIGIQLAVGSTGINLSIFDYGPIVSYDWYAFSMAAATLDIWSTQIGPKG